MEPSDVAWQLAGDGRSGPPSPSHVGLDGPKLPLPDDRCDTALSTFTLCTIPDVAGALAQLRRVLRPGGTLRFLEHGLSPDGGAALAAPPRAVQKRLFGGCHGTDDPDLVDAAGFTLTELDVFYEDGAPKVLAADSLGVAAPASES